jgi:excisionase family DNA binding protein
MNIETDYSKLIDAIVEKVVERLKPLFDNARTSAGDELMNVSEVAKYLKVKESWVYEKIHAKKIPFQKAGRFPRFRKKHIDKWLDNPYAFTSSAYKPLKKEGGNI